MGRGRYKTISASDLASMSRSEWAALGNLARMGLVKGRGTAIVRDADGNAKYDDPKMAGKYNEDRL